MPSLEVTLEQVIALVKQLPTQDQVTLLSTLTTELQQTSQPLDAETQEWLEADLGEDLPDYEWGAEGEPVGKPVHYVPGVGVVVEGGRDGV